MADPEPSERDTAIWEGEGLVYLAGHFLPKRYVSNLACLHCILCYGTPDCIVYCMWAIPVALVLERV